MPKRLTIEEMHEIAKNKGGKCLSNEYINDRTKLTWLCSNGHKWNATPFNIKHETWCPFCAKDIGPRKKMDKTFQKVIEIAIEKGGECLSSTYEKNHSKLRFRCKYGHQWDTTPGRIKRGYWCLICYAKIRREKLAKYTMDDMIKYAQSKGGECLSTEFKGMNSPLIWKCSKGHVWQRNPAGIVYQNAWCRKCGAIERGKKRRTPIEIYQEIAQKHGGKLLSTEYINTQTKMEWQCEEGHKFWSVPGPIKYQDVWCPICSSGISERIVREYFKIIFEKEFPKKHPKWLLSDKGKRMELDGYNEELRIAFEYQGEQHYNPIYFGENKRLKAIQNRDDLKKHLCEKNNVTLITIPYDVKRDEIQNYILTECKKKRLQIIQDKPVDYKTLDVFSPRKLKELQEIAENHGGKCLSYAYIGNKTPLQWQCKEGHIWWAIPGSVKRGSWCAKCSGLAPLNIETMHEWAKKREGKCLSSEYKGNKTKLQWECKMGHVFWMIPNSVQQRQWCPICGYKISGDKLRKYSIEIIRNIAREKNGKCLSSKYINYETKLEWECEKGHTWRASLHAIKSGHWCHICAGNIKGKIEEMKDIAKSQGGKCLSDIYNNSKTKLKWECRQGHIWKAAPSDIKQGHWCPICANNMRGPRKFNRNYKHFPHKHAF